MAIKLLALRDFQRIWFAEIPYKSKHAGCKMAAHADQGSSAPAADAIGYLDAIVASFSEEDGDANHRAAH